MNYIYEINVKYHLIRVDQKIFFKSLSCLNKLVHSIKVDIDLLEKYIKDHRDEYNEIKETAYVSDHRTAYNDLKILLDDWIRNHKYLELYQIQSGMLTLKHTIKSNSIFQKYHRKSDEDITNDEDEETKDFLYDNENTDKTTEE